MFQQVKQPEIKDNVEYISPFGSVVSASRKNRKMKSVVPMEKQLDNLSLTRQDGVSKELPTADNMAQLLTQVRIVKHIYIYIYIANNLNIQDYLFEFFAIQKKC